MSLLNDLSTEWRKHLGYFAAMCFFTYQGAKYSRSLKDEAIKAQQIKDQQLNNQEQSKNQTPENKELWLCSLNNIDNLITDAIVGIIGGVVAGVLKGAWTQSIEGARTGFVIGTACTTAGGLFGDKAKGSWCAAVSVLTIGIFGDL